MLLALKMEEGVRGQGNKKFLISRSWKNQGNRCFLRVSRGHVVLLTPWFPASKAILDLSLQNYKGMNFYCSVILSHQVCANLL